MVRGAGRGRGRGDARRAVDDVLDHGAVCAEGVGGGEGFFEGDVELGGLVLLGSGEVGCGWVLGEAEERSSTCGRGRWKVDGLVGGDVGPRFGVVAGLGGGVGLEYVPGFGEVADLVVSRACWGWWFEYLRNLRNRRNLAVAGGRCWRIRSLVAWRSKSRRLCSLGYAVVAVAGLRLFVAVAVGQTGKNLRSSFLGHFGRELVKQARIILQLLS